VADELTQLIEGLRAGRPDFSVDPQAARANFEALLATLPVNADIRIEQEVLGGVPGLRATCPGVREDCALLYLHGGAYIAGSASGYRGLAAELGRAANMTVHAIDYRLAPEHPFPAAIEDAVIAYGALLQQGLPPERIVLAGDSAGGGLALATLVALRDRQISLPAACLLMSPWADLACEGRSIVSKAQEDPSLTPEGLRAAAMHYLGAAMPRAPLASPIHADLTGLPPLLIQVGSAEILLDDAVRIARAAGAAGVEVRLEIWPRMVHVWQAFAFMLTDGRRAIDQAGAFLADSVGPERASGE
jgi:monoterpene epsilon-lactone hydrolase